MKKVYDVLPARRDVLKLGTYSLLTGLAEQTLWPPKVRATDRSNPRGSARYCVVVEAAGAISHTDTFDFKEGEGTPKDLDVRKITQRFLPVAPLVSSSIRVDGPRLGSAIVQEPRGGAFSR